ncbi:MAG TPA: nitroreductase family protein [Methanospirillum sp.]|nr:nitroreductase family protein [Methanospirillum sp.]
MSEIIIDTSRCTGCGICTRVCPYLIIGMNESTEKALVNPVFSPFCSHCGHCSAICPEAAITVTYPDAGPVPQIAGESMPTPEALSQLILMRRSIRSYSGNAVRKETLEQIFDIVRYAPTGMNGQSVHWLVMQDPDEVRALVSRIIGWAEDTLKKQPDHMLAPLFPMVIEAYKQGDDRICHGAPCLVIAHGHQANPVGFIDSIIALTHLDLTAPVFGLGTCWAGIVQIALDSSPDLMASLGLPEGHKSHYAMMIGYPNLRYARIPSRNTAKIIWK